MWAKIFKFVALLLVLFCFTTFPRNTYPGGDRPRPLTFPTLPPFNPRPITFRF